MDENVLQLVRTVLIFLFLIWLVHRIEIRAAKDAIYKNFPFFKDAVNNFQIKLDYLSARAEALEARIGKIESMLKSKE